MLARAVDAVALDRVSGISQPLGDVVGVRSSGAASSKERLAASLAARAVEVRLVSAQEIIFRGHRNSSLAVWIASRCRSSPGRAASSGGPSERDRVVDLFFQARR